MSDNVMKGRRVFGTSRAPKASSEARLCARDECDTQLSRYNKREYCYTHAPVKYPRLRGRVVPES